MHDEYIGDGVYASFDGYGVHLAVNHHENKVVYLEPDVMKELIAPALVEITQASQQFSELHGGIESTHIPDYCPACRLVCAMKEAGVTCE